MATKAALPSADPQLLGAISKATPESLHHVQTDVKNPLPSKEGKTVHKTFTKNNGLYRWKKY